MKLTNIAVWVVSIFLAIVSLPTNAEVNFSTSVEKIFPTTSGVVDVVFASPPGSCTNTNNPKRFRLVGSGTNSDGVKNVYAALLFAMSANKTVSVYFDETVSNCTITRVLVIN